MFEFFSSLFKGVVFTGEQAVLVLMVAGFGFIWWTMSNQQLKLSEIHTKEKQANEARHIAERQEHEARHFKEMSELKEEVKELRDKYEKLTALVQELKVNLATLQSK